MTTNTRAALRQSRAAAGAFTLIELLVVVVIVAILIALAVLAFQAVRKQGAIAESISNLRALGVASATYSSEHNNEFFPKKVNSIFNWTGKRTEGRTLPAGERPLNPYLGITSANDPARVARSNSYRGLVSYEAFGSSYNSNHFVTRGGLGVLDERGNQISEPGDRTTKKSIRQSQVGSPSRFVVGMEHGAWEAVNSSRDPEEFRTFWPNENRYLLLFADGHVSATLLEKGKQITSTYTFSYLE